MRGLVGLRHVLPSGLMAQPAAACNPSMCAHDKSCCFVHGMVMKIEMKSDHSIFVGVVVMPLCLVRLGNVLLNITP